MKKYSIRISSSAEKSLKLIPKNDQKRIVATILKLVTEPFPEGYKKLSGYNDIYRIRIGNYRVIYSVDQKIITIIILKIGHRKDIYRH
jgi:mRNA interferase RelE/StbE